MTREPRRPQTSHSGLRRRPTTPCFAFLGLLVLTVTAVAGCGEETEIPAPTVPGRSDDGLLTDSALQAVVDRQVARDADALVERLDDRDPRVRARAAFALGSVQEPDAVPALVAALGDPSPVVRTDAAFALGQTGEEDVAAALIEVLGTEPSPEVRRAVIEAVGRVGGSGTIDALAVYRDPKLTAEIALALSRAVVRGVTSEAAVDRAMGGITHPDPEVRMASTYLLARTANTATWYAHRRRARFSLDRYDYDDPAAMWLIRGLGRSGDLFARDEIRTWAREAEDWRIRVDAVQALGRRMPDVETMEAFLDALDDPVAHVRIAVADALAEYALRPEARQQLRRWIDDHPDDWRTGQRLLGVLAINGDSEFVLDYLDDIPLSDLERWKLGLEALAYVGGIEGLVTLERLMASPHSEVAGRATESLALRWRRDRSTEDTHDAYWRVISDAVRTGSPAVIDQATPVLADSVMMARGSPALLRDLLAHPDSTVRAAARSALGELDGESVESSGTGASDASGEAGHPGDVRDPDLPAFLGERIDWSRLRALGPHPLLHLETEEGTIVVRLDAEEAPWTVQTVAELAAAGKYDGVPFHRVVPNFVIQGGDFTRGDGTGGPGFRIGSELTRIPFRRGVIGMASSGKDTEGSQFFITHSPQPHLDGAYTAFGYVVEGMDVVDRIQIGHRIVQARIEPGG